MVKGRSLREALDDVGNDIVKTLRNNLSKAGKNATGKTSKSLRHEVTDEDGVIALTVYGRPFFNAVETGRGPRKSTTQGKFKEAMLEWMQARGIGSALDQKGKEALARFFTWRINKLGDKLFRSGGRKDIFTPVTTDQAVDKIKKVITDQFKIAFQDGFKRS